MRFLRVQGPLHEPGKAGDVGHDLRAIISRDRQSPIERLLSPPKWWNAESAQEVHVPRWRSWISDRLWRLHRGLNIHIIWPFQIKAIGSQVHIALTDDTWAMVTARSSASKKRLLVIGGIIDSGYRGEYFTVFLNMSILPRVIRAGERYSQVIFFDAIRPKIKHGMEPEDFITNRGNTGFGSTGR